MQAHVSAFALALWDPLGHRAHTASLLVPHGVLAKAVMGGHVVQGWHEPVELRHSPGGHACAAARGSASSSAGSSSSSGSGGGGGEGISRGQHRPCT